MKKNTRGRKFVHVPPVIGDNGETIKKGISVKHFSGSIPKNSFMLPIIKKKSKHFTDGTVKVYKEHVYTLNSMEIVQTKKGWSIGLSIKIPKEGRISPKSHNLRKRLLKIKDLNN